MRTWSHEQVEDVFPRGAGAGGADGVRAHTRVPLANAAGYLLNWWSELGWYDDVVHGYTIFAITLVLALYLYGASLTGAAGHGLPFVLTAAALGLAVGGLWEVAEWAYDRLVEGNVIKGKRDTIFDLVWDSLGAVASGVVALGMARN